jgi:hypothetical protein
MPELSRKNSGEVPKNVLTKIGIIGTGETYTGRDVTAREA